MLWNLSHSTTSPTFSFLLTNCHMCPSRISSLFLISPTIFPFYSKYLVPLDGALLLFPILHQLIRLVVFILILYALLFLFCSYCVTVPQLHPTIPILCHLISFLSHWTATFLSHYHSVGCLSFPLFHMVCVLPLYSI